MPSSLFNKFDIKFEHTTVKLIALRSIPKMYIGGEEIGPFEENVEFETKMWIADELVKSGMAKVAAEKGPLNLTELQKIQIRETMQPSRKLSTLPEHFYPKLRRFLKELKEKSSTDPSKAVEFQKALQLGTDIVTCRLNKVTLLASASDQTENILQFLSPEERVLYERLHKEIAEWKLNVMKHGGAIK